MTLPTRRLLMVVNQLESFFNHRLPIARAAKAAGYDVHVAIELADEARAQDVDGLTFHKIPLSRSFAAPHRELQALLSLDALVRDLRPDVMHAFTLKPVLLASLISRLRGAPPVAVSVTGVGSFFLGEGAKEKLIQSALVPALRFALGAKHRIAIVQNPDDRDLVINSLGVPANKVELVPGSGVDIARFAPADEPDGPVRIVLAARMLADKGVREFVEAARILRSRGDTAEFVLAGGLDPANRSAIPEDEIRGWVNAGLVTWLGQVADMAALNRTAHIACLPSYREGLPKSLIEAAACGLPIVTTDTAGCRDIVKPGETGLLVPVRDGAALAEALGQLTQDAALRRRFGQAGRAFAESGFSEDAITAHILAIYDKLLSGGPQATKRP